MKTRLLRISPFSIAYLLATAGFILSLLSVSAILTTPLEDGAQLNMYGFGIITSSTVVNPIQLILTPVFNAAAGFVSGIFAGMFYNLWAQLTGGLSIEIENTNAVEQGAAANP